MIEVKECSKAFGTVKAVNKATLDVGVREVFGLVGSNGAGKSTLLRMMAGIIKPDEGEIQIDGMPVYENEEAKKLFFYISDDSYFPTKMCIRDRPTTAPSSGRNLPQIVTHILQKVFFKHALKPVLASDLEACFVSFLLLKIVTCFYEKEVIIINLTGMILKMRYCILEQVGAGGEGHLYLARDMELGNYWAVKELPLEKKRDVYKRQLDVSVSTGLIHSDALALAGDGTPVVTSHRERKKRICKCKENGITDCKRCV